MNSYERNYKSLLDRMIKNDLALKGNFEGVELLIFPSNQLPVNSQRKQIFLKLSCYLFILTTIVFICMDNCMYRVC